MKKKIFSEKKKTTNQNHILSSQLVHAESEVCEVHLSIKWMAKVLKYFKT